MIIFSRPDSTSDTSSFVSPGTNVPVPVLRVPYTVDALAPLFASRGVDAVVCALGPGAAAGGAQQAMLDAAVAPGSRVRRFVLNEFAWHEEFRGIDDLKAFGEPRRRDREYVRALEGKGEVEGGFSWSGVAVGNPIDWVSQVLLLLAPWPPRCANPVLHEHRRSGASRSPWGWTLRRGRR